jgi:TPR repeat protein
MALAFAVPVAADDFADAKQALEAEQHAKAVRLLGPMAEKGDPRAQHLLGYAHMYGLGAKRSSKQAQYWLMKAAAQDYAPAIGLLGRLLIEIDGSPTRGLPLMKIAVRRGDAATQASLGIGHLIGYPGIPVDVQESKRLLLLAADQKYKFAYLGLAWWHATHRGGKTPDYVEVLKWVIVDARIGKGLVEVYRERALEHLNKAQIAEAKRRAAAWLKAHGEAP